MTLDEANREYELMQNSKKGTIKVQIPNGPLLSCHGSWDYKSNLSEVSLKTTTSIMAEHPLLKVVPLDLSPVTMTPVWLVKVLRQPESNIKNGNNRTQNR